MRIPVHVTAGSRESGVTPGRPLRVRVTARPVDGRANSELVCILSNYYGVRRGAVRIIAGLSARDKVIEIPDADRERPDATRRHRREVP